MPKSYMSSARCLVEYLNAWISSLIAFKGGSEMFRSLSAYALSFWIPSFLLVSEA